MKAERATKKLTQYGLDKVSQRAKEFNNIFYSQKKAKPSPTSDLVTLKTQMSSDAGQVGKSFSVTSGHRGSTRNLDLMPLEGRDIG